MIKNFKDGDTVTPVCTFTRPKSPHLEPHTFEYGSTYTVDYLGTGVRQLGMGIQFITNGMYYDLTGMFKLVPPETDTQRLARELTEQAQVLLDKAKQLEGTVG